MKRWLLPSLLLFVSSIAIARVGLTFIGGGELFADTVEVAQGVQEPGGIEGLTVDGAEAMQAGMQTGMQMIGDHLIPSAEAAASMAIAEESLSAPAERELLESLRVTREKLADMEKRLSEREKQAESAEKRAADRIAELEQLELRIQEMLAQEEKIKSKKIKRLTAVYEGMKADKAAPVIAKMKLNTVVKMFSRMDEKKVGKILSFLPPEKAVVISQALTKQISQVQP